MPTNQKNTAIENIVTSFIESWNAKDIEKFAALFAADADFVGVTGLWTTGREAIANQHRDNFSNMQSQSRLEIIETRIRLVSDSLGIAHSRWKMSGQQSMEGKNLLDKQGVWTIVAQQIAGRWEIVALHNTNIVPPEQAHPDLVR